MAEKEAKDAPKGDDKLVAVFNKGQRTYTTSAGKLMPQKSIQVPEAEAKDLMGYFDIVDLAKIAPKASEDLARLKKENAELKARVAAAESDSKETKAEKGGKKGDK